jgi:xanthine dehydrogenase YagT iron-sulfur-binding subunit
MTAPNQNPGHAAGAVPASGADSKMASAPVVERPLTQFRAQPLRATWGGQPADVTADAVKALR